MQKYKCLYVLLAREFSTDSSDQMSSIIKIIDTFNIEVNAEDLKNKGIKLGEKIITLPVNYNVITSWYLNELITKDPQINVKLTIIDADNNRHEGPSQDPILPVGIDRVNIIFNINGLPISAGGKYTLLAEVFSKKSGKLLCSGNYPFKVNIRQI